MRGFLLGAAIVLASAPIATAAPPPLGGLTQLPGAEGCVTFASTKPCTQNNDIYSPEGVAISPDGRDVYVVENYYGGITQFRRDGAGGLTFVSCVNATGANGCGSFAALNNADAAVVSRMASRFMSPPLGGRSSPWTATPVPGC
jgi:hypothetical protein